MYCVHDFSARLTSNSHPIWAVKYALKWSAAKRFRRLRRLLPKKQEAWFFAFFGFMYPFAGLHINKLLK